MKPTLLFLSLLCTCVLAAQSSKTAFSEQETNGNYSFTVKVDRGQVADLVDCYNLISGSELAAKSRGNFSWTDEDGAVFLLNTRKRTVEIETAENSPEAKAAAKRMAKSVKKHLKTPAAPTPPATH